MTRQASIGSDDWNRLWAIFHELRETPAAEREAALWRLVGDDAILRREVEELLASHEEMPTLFDRVRRAASELGANEGETGNALVGTRIGRYRIERVLGAGGMGVVYEAEQEEPVRRPVALKLLHGGLGSPELVARFAAERQALALMSHPNITRILDGGSDDSGRPWFAMELVSGVPITEYCERQALSTRHRLELFLAMCDGVHHAHQKGILHRDLKPTNVLVTEDQGKALVKVIDFGIARAFDRGLAGATLFTERGQLIGTPEYMSPEQVDMSPDLDIRTDVYSLGVLLYELLVGSLPFDLRGASFSEIQRIVRVERPARPSTRVNVAVKGERGEARKRPVRPRELEGDLDWIVLKALEKERERRYGSVSELAEDVARHLRDEPVSAGPPSRSYRVAKFLRRHRVAMLGVAVAVLALLVGTAGTTWMAVVARRERSQAEEARRRAESEAEISEATSRFLQDMLVAPDPWRSGTTDTPPHEVRVVDVLDRAGQRLETSFGDRPALAATLHRTLGETYAALGASEEAAAQLRQGVVLAETGLGSEHPTTLAARHALASVMRELGRVDEAEEILRSVLAVRRRTLGPDAPETLRTMTSLASVILDRGALEEGAALFAEVLEGMRRSRGEDDPETLAAMNNLGLVRYRLGDLDAAESLLRSALEGRGRLGEDDPGRLSTLGNLGAVLVARGRLEEAEEVMREEAERSERFWGAEHPNTLKARGNLGAVLLRLGRPAEAERQLTALEEQQGRILGKTHAETMVTRNNLARAILDQGREAEAETRFRALVADAEASLPPKSLNLALYRSGFGVCLTRRQKLAEAEAQLARSRAVLEEILGADHARTRQTVGRLADVYEAWGKTEEAERLRAGAP